MYVTHVLWQYSETPILQLPLLDTPLKRTADFLTKATILVEMNSLIRKFSSPISVLIRAVSP